jgi:tRNA nucleotidyltransferase (CCA-adding enzyme)
VVGLETRSNLGIQRTGSGSLCLFTASHFISQLLGSQSNDIDIALEKMMGVTFAEHFVSFVSLQKNLPVKDVTKIERNPDQSKHLETGRTTVLGIEMDFVNLRSEEYAGDSRIPTEIVSVHSLHLFESTQAVS